MSRNRINKIFSIPVYCEKGKKSEMFIEKMKLNLRALQIKFISELEWISD